MDFGYCEKIVELHPTIGCLKSLRHLSLRRCKSLKELPQEIWQSTSLTELDLTYCFQITTLPSQLGDSKSLKQQLLLGSLKVLKLSGCEDFTISPDFTSMPHLEVLHLDYCYKLEKLDPSIGQLKSLTHLSLRGCTSLKELPKEVWQLTSLKELNLCYCSKITNLPSQLPDSKLLNHPLLDKLEIPDLSGCDNITICPDFKTMPHLEKLDFVSCQRMIELYPSIGHLKNLVHLDLSGCISLEALPLELWQLESLERLDLSVCSQIKALPSQLRNVNSLKPMLLYKLKVLNLSGCDNLTVCPNFSSMPHLDKLQFGGCKMMKELHPSIGFLKNLTYLSLKGCISMTNLPQEIWQLTSLEVLDMSDCTQIATLPPQLGYLKSLRQLFLGRTSITTMPEAMGHLKQLKYLSLQQCSSLREIHKCVCSLHNLEEVDAANCVHLASLPNSLGNLKSLRKLDLSWTAIEELPDSIASLEKLEVLTVAGCKGLKFLPASASIGSMLLKWYGVSSTNDGSLVNESSERQRFSFPEFLSSLTELDASGCYELERIANVSNAKELQELNLTGCQKLVDVPGIEQLKQLRILKLGGCGSLYNSFRERVQEANFHNLVDFSIPGSLEESPDEQSLSFFLLKWFETGTLFLRLNACGLDSIVVEIDIRTDDGQLLFQTSVQARVWRTYDWLPRDCLTKVELGEYVKPMRNDAEKRRKMMMRVSIEGHLLLDGCYRSELYVDYDDMGYYPNNLTAANIWVNFGAPFHQYDGSVVLYLNFGSS
ncbi:SUPPRESSOR OF npr1-1 CONSTITUTIVE 1 protein [Nymphaea thermarum]|nr:SUPPRESSOR OF npr1-1 CONSTITUTIVE 1 protein [Nymphaea thermarum]